MSNTHVEHLNPCQTVMDPEKPSFGISYASLIINQIDSSPDNFALNALIISKIHSPPEWFVSLDRDLAYPSVKNINSKTQ